MDQLVAIAVGLALRTLLLAVCPDVHRSSLLVGIWEGVVLRHFLSKSRSSFDPHVAFAVRLFLDFLLTRSFTRLLLVLLWSFLALFLADLAVDLRKDRRFRRLTRHFLSRLTARHRPRVQFVSTSSSSSALRSPVILPSRAAPPPPVRLTTRPVPGSFDRTAWSETNTDVGVGRAEQDTPQPPRTPSELEYIDLPTIPTPAAHQTAFFSTAPRLDNVNDADADDDGDGFGHLDSGLTTPTRERAALEEEEGVVRSGLTTPEGRYPPLASVLPPMHTHTAGLPPVHVLPDAHEYTPTKSQLDLPPIPIPIRQQYASHSVPPTFPEPELEPDAPANPMASTASLPVIPDADPPADPPPEYERTPGEDPDPDFDASTNIDPTNPLPPPDDAPDAPDPHPHAHPPSPAPSSSPTLASSAISAHTRTAIIARADDLRARAQEQEAERERIRGMLRDARREGRDVDVLCLEVEMEEVGRSVEALHAKAARRYYRAHNLNPEPQTVDVHRLSVAEAIVQVKKALRDARLAGSTELRVITGRGKHNKNKVPVLKPAVMKLMQDYRIAVAPDKTNPGLLVVALPSTPFAGASGSAAA